MHTPEADQQDSARLAEEMNFQQRLHLEIDNDAYHQQLHQWAHGAVANNIKRTQINQLLHLAEAAQTWSEIINFMLRQTAKHPPWKKPWSIELRTFLRGMVDKAEQLTPDPAPTPEPDQQRIFQIRLRRQQAALSLMRGMINHFYAFFVFEDATNHERPRGRR